MLPSIFQQWFDKRGWQPRTHQLEMLHNYIDHKSTLLLAPTGGGKTLAGFLPVLIDLYEQPSFKGLHTLYISPLKSLTNDIARNLQNPISEMNLAIRVETRTGDTPSSQRSRQKKNPPHILLTTPESLALLLTYPEAGVLFKTLQAIIVDEVHSLAANKRGDQTTLLLARLQQLAPQARRMGLSATVSNSKAMQTWLDCTKDVRLIQLKHDVKPIVKVVFSKTPLPLAGHYPSQGLIKEIYNIIESNKTTIVFVNTRAQAERIFQDLWAINDKNLAIGIHHGSLTKEQRVKIEEAMTQQQLKAVVATSSLDLGIDWGNLDMIVNVGAPKGISRLMQRIGRSNHRLETPSRAILLPTNCFEALECQAALQAINNNVLDDAPPNKMGALDVLAQHIMSCACSVPIDPEAFYKEVITAYPYHSLNYSLFLDTFNFVVNGGYVLQHYERYQRLVLDESGLYKPRSIQIKQRHRMNIGTIVEAEKLKVMLITGKAGKKRRRGKGLPLGDIEERLILGMEPGDTFLFAGRVLRYEAIRDLIVEVTPSTSQQAKVPAFLGGRMPLSSHLSEAIRNLISSPSEHKKLPNYIQEWMGVQQRVSCLPDNDKLLVELFERHNLHYITAYTFQGRPTNQTLGFLLSHRLEKAGFHPIGFAVSDYGISIWSLKCPSRTILDTLFNPELYKPELEDWLQRSSMLKRFFRTTAVISGLIERKSSGHLKTGKQVTFSTDLIYDVLHKYDSHHLLLRSTRQDVERDLIDIDRLRKFLQNHQSRIQYQMCKRVTPFSIPIILESIPEHIQGTGTDALLALHTIQEKAAILYQEAIDG